VGPVLLLDMGVVVLLVGPPPGELDLLGLAVVPEMLVDELRAIVGVDDPRGPSRTAEPPPKRTTARSARDGSRYPPESTPSTEFFSAGP